MLKNLSIPASVEKYPLTAKLDQRGESPSFGHGCGLPKCVVENRDAMGGFTFAKGWKQKDSQPKNTRKSRSHGVLFQKQDRRGAIFSGHCSPMERVLPTPAWSVAVSF